MLATALALSAQDLALECVALPGLPAVSVTEILETADRRLWFGGTRGLWVHDGESLHGVELPGDASATPRVRHLAAGPDGDLYVATQRGLLRIARGSSSAEPVPGTEDLQVSQLAVDSRRTCWLRSDSSLLRLDPDGSRHKVLEHSGPLVGLCSSADTTWAWTRDAVWCRSGAGSESSWRGVAELTLRDACVDGESLIGITAQGLVRVGPAGQMNWLLRGDIGSSVALGDGELWLRGSRELRCLRDGEQQLREVAFFRNENPITGQSVSAVYHDDSGLLWLGTPLGVMRVNRCQGIENHLVRGIGEGEKVTSFAESHHGMVMLGTEHGRVLCSEQPDRDTWVELATDWPGPSAVLCVAFDGDARAWVGTRQHGVWVHAEGRWRGVVDRERCGVLRDMFWHGGSMWLCGNNSLLRIAADGRVEELTCTGVAVGKLNPSQFLLDVEGTLWLSSYRGWLCRWDEQAACFTGTQLTNEGLLGIADADPHRAVYAATLHALWRVDGSGNKLQPWPAHGRSAFRELVAGTQGVLWQARKHHLLRFDGAEVREIGAAGGAHPLEYSFRAGMRRANGEVWLGAGNGYSRIRPGADLRRVERGQVRGFAVFDESSPGRAVRYEASATARVSTSFRVVPALLDRSMDLPIAYAVRLEPLDDAEPVIVGDGAFVGVPEGRYRLEVELPQTTGATVHHALGDLVVTAPRAWLVPAGIVALVAMLFGIAWWRVSRRHPWQPHGLSEALRRMGQDPEEVLDLAFVIVAATESCRSASRAQHASAWIGVGEQPDSLLAEFGSNLPDREARLASIGAARGAPTAKSASGEHLVIELAGPHTVVFRVLLFGLPAVGDDVREAIERELAPARAALSRYAWLDRLQAYIVNSSLSLEADLHDLRGSLTALRLGVSELGHERGRGDPLIDNMAIATDALLQAVERLQSRRSIELEPGDPVALLREVVAGQQPVAQRHGMSLDVAAPAGIDGVELDPVWFRRAVENVIGNAIKYSGDGRQVWVRVSVEPGQVVIVVEDEGPGIDAQERERLFLPGVVGKAEPRAGESKTGIGLWVSRQALRSMGGRIWIEPRASGGTRVCLSLPHRPGASTS